jgi:hypothetical protein
MRRHFARSCHLLGSQPVSGVRAPHAHLSDKTRQTSASAGQRVCHERSAGVHLRRSRGHESSSVPSGFLLFARAFRRAAVLARAPLSDRCHRKPRPVRERRLLPGRVSAGPGLHRGQLLPGRVGAARSLSAGQLLSTGSRTTDRVSRRLLLSPVRHAAQSVRAWHGGQSAERVHMLGLPARAARPVRELHRVHCVQSGLRCECGCARAANTVRVGLITRDRRRRCRAGSLCGLRGGQGSQCERE